MRIFALSINGQCLDTVGILHQVRTGSIIIIAVMLDYPSLFDVQVRICIVRSSKDWQTKVTFVPTSHVRRRAESGACS